ncbi:MAG: rhodanese-like domain-containing protein [Deltaproteobacteria bacterium]|nr:rhodanese-like domain-containing protein [Deltaproteobacteria bacterium]
MKTVNYQELTKMIEPGKKHPVLINTLPQESFAKDHIPGSINIPQEQLSSRAPGLFGKQDWIVVYCAGPTCQASEKAANWLEQNGYQNVYRFTGGMEEWKSNSNYCCHETTKVQGKPQPQRKVA